MLGMRNSGTKSLENVGAGRPGHWSRRHHGSLQDIQSTGDNPERRFIIDHMHEYHMTVTTYPHTIDNGAGERLTFSRRVSGVNGDRIEGENLVSPGSGPPMHVHYFENEGFTILEGRIGFQIAGEPPQFAEEGESIAFPAGVPHRFWNAGDRPLRCAAYIEPVGNVEYFLGALFASQKQNGGHRPNLLDAAYLMRRYRYEFGYFAVPALVQRSVFPVLIAIGTALGRYARYADAPEPRTNAPSMKGGQDNGT